jgi:hypothetical protein
MSDVNHNPNPTPDAPPPRPLGPNPPVHVEYVGEKPLPAGSAVTKEVRTEEIARESPEGRPADAEIGSRGLKGMVLVLAAATLVAAVLLGVFASVPLGLAVAGLGIVFLLINPTIGAALVRSKERGRVEDRHGERTPRGA